MDDTTRETHIERGVRDHFAGLALPETIGPEVTNDPAMMRKIRRAAAMSQAEAAGILGVRQAQVSHWEAGNRVPGQIHAPALFHLLKLLHEEVTGR
jgi:DNA-binding transcriptional regulator YiaG